MEQVIAWGLMPEFPEIGRSAWVKLIHPFEAPCGQGTQVIRSLKLKGVGLRDHRGGMHYPSNTVYRRPDAHLGIDEDGVFCEVWSAPAPMGALALNRAIVEYTTARELCAVGPISEVPLFVYRYTKLEGFRDDSGSVSDLAVLVAGLPTDSPVRADNLVHYAKQSPSVQAALRGWARAQTGDGEFDWAGAQLALWGDYGKRLREFHGCGFYRHNAHASNLGLGAHGIFLVDLDSTRYKLDCPPRTRALQAVRDAATGVFHVIADTVRSGELRSVEHAMSIHRMLVNAFLRSYFPEVPTRAFEDLEADTGLLTSTLWEKWDRGTFRPSGWAQGISGKVGVENPAKIEYQQFMTERYAYMTQGLDIPALVCKLMPGLARISSLSTNAYEVGGANSVEVSEAADEFLRRRQGANHP
ncbi:hypothetical protein [Phytohabitans flavus]